MVAKGKRCLFLLVCHGTNWMVHSHGWGFWDFLGGRRDIWVKASSEGWQAKGRVRFSHNCCSWKKIKIKLNMRL